MTDEEKKKYPYTLDAHLKEAMKLAAAARDYGTEGMLWQIFISYRKSDYKKPEAQP
jgi:hypothetical protein